MKTFKLFVALMVLGTFVSVAPAAQAQERHGRGGHQPTFHNPPPVRVEPGRGGERGGDWQRGRGGERGHEPVIVQRHPEWRPPVRNDRWENRDGRYVRPIEPGFRPGWGVPIVRRGYVPPYWRGPVPGINIGVVITSGHRWVYPRGCNYFGGYWYGGIWIDGPFFAIGTYRPTGIFYYPGYGWMDPVAGVYVQAPPATLEPVTVVVQETVYEQVWDANYGTYVNVPSQQTWYYTAQWNASYGAYGYYDFHGAYHLLP